MSTVEMLEASPKGTVPVFIRKNGTVIEESLELLLFALSQNDPMGWLNCDRHTADTLIAANDGSFKHHLDRYKYASRYKENATRGDIDLTHRAEAENHLKILEIRLEGPMGDCSYLTNCHYLDKVHEFMARINARILCEDF